MAERAPTGKNCIRHCKGTSVSRCASKGPQLQRPKVADVAEWNHVSLRAVEAFGILMLKYGFSHIPETLFLSLLTFTSTPKTYNLYYLTNDMVSETGLELFLI